MFANEIYLFFKLAVSGRSVCHAEKSYTDVKTGNSVVFCAERTGKLRLTNVISDG